MELLFITNEPQIARTAVSAGVQRIFVDLEIAGKKERLRRRWGFGEAALDDELVEPLARRLPRGR